MRVRSITTRKLVIVVAIVVLGPIRIMAVSTPREEPYFPKGAFDNEDKGRNDFWDETYTKTLRAMGEPSLWELSEVDRTATVFRLLWVPSFHHRMSVRIVKSCGVVPGSCRRA